MLDEIVKNKTLKAKGVVGIWPANATGDDIEVYAADTRARSSARSGTLRQQEEREDDHYLAMSDFVAPKDSGRTDYVGAFAVSCGVGCHEICEQYRKENDDYRRIMMEAIADRLAEAFAELIHAKMRKPRPRRGARPRRPPRKVKYQRIRPAPGYPTQPDHTEKNFMWKILDAEKSAGISLPSRSR